jgi:hypothetical protein
MSETEHEYIGRKYDLLKDENGRLKAEVERLTHERAAVGSDHHDALSKIRLENHMLRADVARLTIERDKLAGKAQADAELPSTDVYSRPECRFHYCPYTPEICQAEGSCQHPTGEGDGS